ncbi:hypothetical protein ACNS7O_02795 [Haloferacaceae archaeon DSL9]
MADLYSTASLQYVSFDVDVMIDRSVDTLRRRLVEPYDFAHYIGYVDSRESAAPTVSSTREHWKRSVSGLRPQRLSFDRARESTR